MKKSDIQSVLISESEIKEIVKEMGRQITADFAGEELLVVCILKGSCVFFSDLVREIDADVKFDFMVVSSYGNGTTSSTYVNVIHDLSTDIKGKNVLIVEDIIDSGRTIKCLKELLLDRHPAKLKIATLLNKPDRREVEISSDYVGKDIPNEFIVGYGLDYAQKYRNLKDICVLAKEVYEK